MVKDNHKNIEILYAKEYNGEIIIHFSDLAAIFKTDSQIFETAFFKNDIFSNSDFYILDKSKNNIKILSNIIDPYYETEIWTKAFYLSKLMSMKPDYSGYIYIALDPEKDLYKIGRTSAKVENRIKQLNTGRTVHIKDFESYYCKNIIKAEETIHKILKEYRVVGEWFALDVSKIRSTIEKVINDINSSFSSESTEIIFLTQSAISKLISVVNKDNNLNLSASNDLLAKYFSCKSATDNVNELFSQIKSSLKEFENVIEEIKLRITPQMPDYNLWIDGYATPAMTKLMKKYSLNDIKSVQNMIFEKMKENYFCYELEFEKFCDRYNIQDTNNISPLWVIADKTHNIVDFVKAVNQLMETGNVEAGGVV